MAPETAVILPVGSLAGPCWAHVSLLFFGKRFWSYVLSQTAVSWNLICLKTICATGSFCKHHSVWLKASRAFGRGKWHRDWERHKWARKRMEHWCQVRWLWPHLSWARPVIIAAALRAALWVPILPDFLKLSPGFTDSAKTNRQIVFIPTRAYFLEERNLPQEKWESLSNQSQRNQIQLRLNEKNII